MLGIVELTYALSLTLNQPGGSASKIDRPYPYDDAQVFNGVRVTN